jgi:hypothetical protein
MEKRTVKILSGCIVNKNLRQGTGSQHTSLVLNSAGNNYVLVKLNSNPFEIADSIIDGTSVEVEGYLVNNTLRYTRITIL